MGRRIFISYAHENHAQALRCHRAVAMLCARLRGTTAIFLDCEGEDRLRAGDEWQAKILAALDEADVFLVLLSDAYFASHFCRQVELKRIFERWQAEPQRIKVVGVALHRLAPESFGVEGLDPAPTMGRFQCLPQGRIELEDGRHKLGLKPISDWPERSPENAWDAVARDLQEALNPSRWEMLTSRRGRPWLVLGAVTGLALCAALLLGLQWLALTGDVRQALRMDEPARAGAALDSAPRWLKSLPAWSTWRELSQLHADGFSPEADPLDLELRLQRLEAKRVGEADVHYLRARLAYQSARSAKDLDRMAELANAAVAADPEHAAAWALLALERDLRGDLKEAALRYGHAAALAPASPQYAAAQARALLDMGQPDSALALYGGLRNFPLGQAEEAMAHWALGQFVEAATAQDAALRALGSPKVAAQSANLRGWIFVITDPWQTPPRRVEIAFDAAESRCYLAYGRLFSLALAGEREIRAVSAPDACSHLAEPDDVQAVRDVLDADLCRYVVDTQSPARDKAEALRQHLGKRRSCRPAQA